MTIGFGDIHGELLKLGFAVAQSTSAKDMAKKATRLVRAGAPSSHAAFRPGQLGPVKAKFLVDAAYNARVKDLARSAERNFRLPSFVMDYHHDWALPSLLMPVVEAASAVG